MQNFKQYLEEGFWRRLVGIFNRQKALPAPTTQKLSHTEIIPPSKELTEPDYGGYSPHHSEHFMRWSEANNPNFHRDIYDGVKMMRQSSKTADGLTKIFDLMKPYRDKFGPYPYSFNEGKDGRQLDPEDYWDERHKVAGHMKFFHAAVKKYKDVKPPRRKEKK